MLVSPLSGEAAAEVSALEDCAVACFHEHHADSAGGDHDKGDHAHHAHHAHGCGSCHVHMLMVRAGPPPCVTTSSERRMPRMEDFPCPAPAGAVFHPPRV